MTFCRRRSGPRTVVKSTSVFACFEPLGGPCSCLMKQNSCAKNRSTPLDRLSEAIPCEDLAYLCLREQESFLTPHIAPASRAIDASPSLSLSGRGKCIRLMLCLSFYEWRCIYPGEQMILAPFLEKNSLDRAPRRFADNLFVRKHAKADVLLTTVMGLLRRRSSARAAPHPSLLAGDRQVLARGGCCIRQGLSLVLMPLPGLAPVSPFFGLRPVGRLSLPKWPPYSGQGLLFRLSFSSVFVSLQCVLVIRDS